MSPARQRVVAVCVLLAAGVLSLPLTALFLDRPGAENWIIPVQLAVMATLGGALARALPALARAGTSPAGRVLTGAVWGLLAALVGVLVFWFLLNGLRGA